MQKEKNLKVLSTHDFKHLKCGFIQEPVSDVDRLLHSVTYSESLSNDTKNH